MERYQIAYVLIALTVAAAAAWFAYSRHNSYKRVNRRRETRECAEYEKHRALSKAPKSL